MRIKSEDVRDVHAKLIDLFSIDCMFPEWFPMPYAWKSESGVAPNCHRLTLWLQLLKRHILFMHDVKTLIVILNDTFDHSIKLPLG